MTEQQHIARSLRQFAVLFRWVAAIAGLVALVLGIWAGMPESRLADELGWSLTRTVALWWAIGLGVVLEGVWLGLVSDAVSLILAPPVPPPPGAKAEKWTP